MSQRGEHDLEEGSSPDERPPMFQFAFDNVLFEFT